MKASGIAGHTFYLFIFHSFIYLAAPGLSCRVQDIRCGMRDLQLWHANFYLWHVGSSSPIWDQTRGPCSGSAQS